MAKIYYNLIISGYYTIDMVPDAWKEDVQLLIDADDK